MQEPTQENESTQGNPPEETQQSTQPEVVLTTNTNVTDFQSMVKAVKDGNNIYQKSLVVALENYIRDMAPGIPMDSDKGARFQHTLWKSISYIAEQIPVEEFKKCWSLLLAFFHEYRKGVFHERYVFRFSEFWIWSEDELNAFQRVLNLIKLTTDSTTRNTELRHVDIDRTLSVGFSDEARQRIVNFYKG